MSNRKLALAILALLFSVATPLSVVDLVSANYSPPPSIEIPSPISSPKVYQDNSIPLYVNVNVQTDAPDITYICYSLDGNANVTITNLTKTEDVSYWTTTPGVFAKGNAFRTESTLNSLTDGTHTLAVYSHDTVGKEMSKSIDFTVDSNYVPPQPQLTDSMNHTAATTHPMDPTGTAQPTTNTDSFQPLENPLLFILIACVAVSLLGAGLYFRKKSGNFMKLKGKEKIP